MKTIKIIALVFGLFFLNQTVSAQNGKNVKEVTIETSIQCGMCVNKLEGSFADYWAVKDVKYNLEEQEITVTYNSKKTNEKAIKEHIAKVGYDADEVEADAKAYNALPACCKKGAHMPEKKDASEKGCSQPEGEACKADHSCCSK